jgi:hypothetical protein
MNMDQQQPTGFWQPHDDRKDMADDFTSKCQHRYGTWAGNPYVQRCRCGDWYYSQIPNSLT